MNINRHDLEALASTYRTIIRESHDAHEQDAKERKLSDPKMQAALAILQQYAQGDITNVEAAEMFKDLYTKGIDHGPTQDDQYYTKLN